jgi:hypothetical protein
VAQYPLEMGKKESNSFGTAGTSSAIVPVTYDSEGKVRYEAIVEYGRTPGQKVFAKPSDVKEKTFTYVFSDSTNNLRKRHSPL